jgi:flagellar L-ring protein precursor FlgH
MIAKRKVLFVRAGVIAALAAGAPATPLAQAPQKYEEIFYKYLEAARKLPPPGPIWMADLMSDLKAHRVNDLVTIRVLESLSATGAADSTVNKKSTGDVTMPGKAGEYIHQVLPVQSDTKFNGSGNTTRTTELTAIMTARVLEVLPSGDMVVEGVREIDINGDRNVVVLTGVIRAADILPGNVIPSTLVGQLRIRSLSQGLIKDSLTPGWLIRALNKIF